MAIASASAASGSGVPPHRRAAPAPGSRSAAWSRARGRRPPASRSRAGSRSPVSPCSAATNSATPRASPSASVDCTLRRRTPPPSPPRRAAAPSISSRSPRPISASRTGRACRAGAEITPHSTYATFARRPGALDDAVTEAQRPGIDAQDTRRRARASARVSRRSRGRTVVDVHVRVDVLNVVVVFQRVDQLHGAHRRPCPSGARCSAAPSSTSACAGSGSPAFFEPLADALELLRLGHHDQRLALGADVLGARARSPRRSASPRRRPPSRTRSAPAS